GAIEIILEDVLCPTFNKEYLTEPDVYLDANNQAFVNFSIIKQFPPDVQVRFHLLGASMGEFVIETGIDVEMGLCEIFGEPVIMGPLLKLYGFVAADCPPSPGVYGNQGYNTPMELMPDDFIPNKYLSIVEFSYEEEKLIIVYTYFNVQ
ncbi:Protein of unknown function, partial [Cotesia congregata]